RDRAADHGDARMKATTRRLDVDIDLLATGEVLFERNRVGLAGRGVAARVPLRDVDDVLAAIEVDDEVGVAGCGPVAFGALPFDPDADAELVIPREIFGRLDDGTRWHTVIDAPPVVLEAMAHGNRSLLPREPPSGFEVVPSRSPASWCELVEHATKTMAEGPLRKVVLAREIVVTADAPFDLGTVLERLRAT